MADVGLSVVEGVSNGLTPFKEPAKRNIGLIMERERGPENLAINYNSLADDRLIFGGYKENQYGALVTRNLIKNAQGYSTNIYGVRVIGSGSSAATVNVTIPGGSVTMEVTAARQGIADKGDWANNDLVVNLYAYNSSVRNKWHLEVVYKGKVVETYTEATVAAIQAIINVVSNYVIVSFSAEPSTSTVLQTGTGTITTQTSGTAETRATGTIEVTNFGDTGDIATITVGATVLGDYTVQGGDSQPEVAEGLKLAINAGLSGYTATRSSATLTVSAPIGSGATPNGFSFSIDVSTGSTLAFNTTDFADGITAIPPVATTAVVGSGTAFTTQLVVGSILYDTDNNPIGVVSVITDNTHLTLAANSLVLLNGAAFKYTLYPVVEATLVDGVYVAPSESDFYPVPDSLNPTGLACFDGVNVQIIATTEFHTLNMAQQGRDYCAGNPLRPLFVANLPYLAADSVIVDYADALQSNTTSYIAGYNAWVKTSNDNGDYVWVPSIGCVLGAGYIRVPNLQGDLIHIPPAGLDSNFVDVIEVTPARVSQERLNALTRDYTVNSVVFQEGKGYFIMTSRTYSTNALYNSVHIRLQTSFYERVLKDNLGFAIQKPNTPELKKSIYISCFSFFKTEYDRGALERSVKFEVACKIIIDQTNNPPSQDRKQLNLDVDWIPTETVEAMRTSLNRNDGLLIVQSTGN